MGSIHDVHNAENSAEVHARILTELRCVAPQSSLDQWLLSIPVNLVAFLHGLCLFSRIDKDGELWVSGVCIQHRHLRDITLDSSVRKSKRSGVLDLRRGNNISRVERELGSLTC